MIEEELVNKLIDLNLKISFAESCTGGMCASKLVNVSNASKVFDVSFVTYAASAKIKYLGLTDEFIKTYGIVSEDVAALMAKGVSSEAGSDIGVGVTGMAGPSSDGITPVGRVCFGVYYMGSVSTFTLDYGAIGRNKVREEATEYIFEMVLSIISR